MALLDRDAVAARMCIRADKIARLVRDGKFPKPDHFVGPRSPRWDEQTLDRIFKIKPVAPQKSFSDSLAEKLNTNGSLKSSLRTQDENRQKKNV